MDEKAKFKLEQMRADFYKVNGCFFSYFYCPILFRDDNVDLCKAHIVNAAFPNARRSWTIQRADVDSFYGSMFEADFVDIQYIEGNWCPAECIADKNLAKRFRPRIEIEGTLLDYYVTQGSVPPEFTEAILKTPTGNVRLVLKTSRDELITRTAGKLQIVVEKDLTVPVVVSVLKAAHLTLFEMLNYSYGLSAGGYFVGRTVLGEFFLQNHDKSRSDVAAQANMHFHPYVNMVRPVISHTPTLKGTAVDRRLYLCPTQEGNLWSVIVFVRTSQLVYAILMPVFETPSAVHHFFAFLKADRETISIRECQFESGEFRVAKNVTSLTW